MSNPKLFVERVRELVGGSPGELVAEWRDFTELVECGYRLGICEYEHDLGVRDRIERLLTDPVLDGMPEMGWVRAEVAEIDERFRALLTSDSRSSGDRWWWYGNPRRGPARVDPG